MSRSLIATRINRSKITSKWIEPISIAGKAVHHKFTGESLFDVQVAAKAAGCALPVIHAPSDIMAANP